MSEEDRIVNELLERNGKIRLARKVYKLENIIKEVREYIYSTKYEWGDLEQDNEDFDIDVYKILEILDKEVN